MQRLTKSLVLNCAESAREGINPLTPLRPCQSAVTRYCSGTPFMPNPADAAT